MAAWTAIICILSSLANYGVKTDLKQLLRCVIWGTGKAHPWHCLVTGARIRKLQVFE